MHNAAARIYKMPIPSKVHSGNQVTKGWQFDLIITQLFVGFLAALGGVLLFIMTDSYLAHYELFNEVLYAICSAYGGMLVGMGVVGFGYLKLVGCQRYLPRFIIQSIIGLIALPLAIYAPLKIFNLSISPILVNMLAAFLPLVGAILGFNFLLVHTLKKKSRNQKQLPIV